MAKTTATAVVFSASSLGGDLLSHVQDVVPSALRGLTAVFGMGTGDPSRHSHPKIYRVIPSKLYIVVIVNIT